MPYFLELIEMFSVLESPSTTVPNVEEIAFSDMSEKFILFAKRLRLAVQIFGSV